MNNLLKFKNKNYYFIKECDMNHLIFYSSANIGFFSNSLIESSILGVKTIRLLSLMKDINLDPLKHFNSKFINIYDSNLLSQYLY